MNLVQMMEQKGYVPAARAAATSGVAVTTIYRRIKSGKLDGTRVGDYWYVSIDSLIADLGPVASEAAGLC